MEVSIEIKVSEIAVGRDNTRIRTLGIGSCIVVCLYDYANKIGGMAHAMLPSNFNKSNKSKIKKEVDGIYSGGVYLTDAIEFLYKTVMKIGADPEKMKAKLIGGGAMFNFFNNEDDGIGLRNVISAKRVLHKYKIPIKSEAVGGNFGRTAEINLSNGVVVVSTRI